jgi:hypothetical protein
VSIDIEAKMLEKLLPSNLCHKSLMESIQTKVAIGINI